MIGRGRAISAKDGVGKARTVRLGSLSPSVSASTVEEGAVATGGEIWATMGFPAGRTRAVAVPLALSSIRTPPERAWTSTRGSPSRSATTRTMAGSSWNCPTRTPVISAESEGNIVPRRPFRAPSKSKTKRRGLSSSDTRKPPAFVVAISTNVSPLGPAAMVIPETTRGSPFKPCG